MDHSIFQKRGLYYITIYLKFPELEKIKYEKGWMTIS